MGGAIEQVEVQVEKATAKAVGEEVSVGERAVAAEVRGEAQAEVQAGQQAEKAQQKPDYSTVPDPEGGATAGGEFTAKQKQAALEANKKANGGVVKSDGDGRALVKPKKSQKGVTPDQNEWQFDHKDPKAKGGTNSGGNLQILSREENRKKSDK